jgi:hypothetical protein
VGSKKRRILRVSNNPDRRNPRIRAMSNSGEPPAGNRSKETKRRSVVPLAKDKTRRVRRKERERKPNGPSRSGAHSFRPTTGLYIMTLRTERSGSRFVARTDDGKTVIHLELFHGTVSGLKTLSVGFARLSGTTLEQAKALVDTMNESIVGVIVAPK